MAKRGSNIFESDMKEFSINYEKTKSNKKTDIYTNRRNTKKTTDDEIKIGKFNEKGNDTTNNKNIKNMNNKNTEIKVTKEFNIDDTMRGDDIVTINKVTKQKRRVKKIMNTTWVDKYRPKKIDEVIGHDDVKNMLKKSIEQGNLPHLLFHGASGTGKTSIVLALVMELYGPERVSEKVLELNASDENNIGVVRDKIIKFANIVVGSNDPKYPSPPFKIIILDEADSMTFDAQTALKKVMEATCEITRFVLICNYESKIIDAIKSRCADFRFSPIPDDIMIEKLKKIAATEGMNVNDDVYKAITTICEGDARRSINTLQNLKYIARQSVTNNYDVTKEDVYAITSYIDAKYIKPYWRKIRKGTIIDLKDVTITIINLGYPMTYVLQCIKDKVLKSLKISNEKKSKIIIYIGKVERMITFGSDNWIQLMGVLTFINAQYRDITVTEPCIY